MYVAARVVRLRLRQCRSLKEKRAVIKPILEGSRRRFGVAAAEVSGQDLWQSATLCMAAVSSSAAHAEEVLDHLERFVWSFPEVEVLECRRRWMSEEGN